MISLTKIAAKNFKRIREDEELSEDVPLRVIVKGGGCAGYEYVLEFGESTKRDLYFESEGLPKANIGENKTNRKKTRNYL